MDLTIPEPGSTSARNLYSRALGAALAELKRVAQRRVDDPALGRDLARLARLLDRVDPGALATALRRPTVSTFLRCARSSDGPLRGLVSALIGELCAMGALDEPFLLEAPSPRAIVLSRGRAYELRGAVRSLDDFESRPSHVRINERQWLALLDDSPLADFEAHPDKEGNTLDLGGRAPEVWVSAIADALAMIAEHVPELVPEIDLFVEQLVPVGWYAERHLSASLREAIGTIYLSLHDAPLTMVEALIHEFSHNKLNALFELDRLIENPETELHKSPVRPDPRPLRGVLLAVHAFFPVARFYERRIAAGHPELRERFDQIRAKNREGCSILFPAARPTRLGGELLAELARWDDHYR